MISFMFLLYHQLKRLVQILLPEFDFSSKLYDTNHIVRKYFLLANNKGAKQTVQMPSLLSAFVIRCLESIVVIHEEKQMILAYLPVKIWGC